MITLTAKINLISSNNNTLNIGTNNLVKNNISSEIGGVKGVKKQVGNPFILGASKLGKGATFSDGVDYFIGNQQSNEEGIFENAYTLTINSVEPITSLTIAFDTENNRHPNKISIDNKEYADDNAIFTIAGLSSLTSHTITINNWNTPNYPIVISGIYVDISIDIDYRNLISLNRSIIDRADIKLPSFGIISNGGNIKFNDLNGEIKDYAEQLLLTSDLKVEITLNNTLSNSKEQVGVFETKDWDYDNDNRSVSVSLKDDLVEWQDIYVEGFSYDAKNRPTQTLYDFYQYLYERTPTKYNMLYREQLDDETKSILQKTMIQYPMLESGNLWQQWTKLCQVAQAHIYKLNNGETIFIYKGGD